MSNLPTARAVALGGAITEAMSQQGWQGNELAHKLAWNPSKVSRLKLGSRHSSVIDVAMALAVLDVKDPIRQELLAVTEDLHQVNGWLPPEMSPAAVARFLAQLEMAASRLHTYSANSVPPLLQAPDYTRFLLSDQADYITCRTQGRSQFINTPPISQFFIGEAALTHADLPLEVLSSQLHHLLTLAVRPEIDIRLVPDHTDIPNCPAFTYLTFNEHRPLVFIEAMNTAAFLEHASTIKSCRDTITMLTQRALPSTATRTRLLDLATELASRTPTQAGPCRDPRTTEDPSE